MEAAPVVHWGGGKKRLIAVIKRKLPEGYNNYYEPFLGGGSVMLGIKHPNKIIVNDFNGDLINLYKQIRRAPGEFVSKLERLKKAYIRTNEKKLFFYTQRANFNKLYKQKNMKRAVLFLFINKL